MQSGQSENMRRHMVDSQLRTSGVNTPWVIAAMLEVPREKFVPADRAATAYMDRALPLGEGRMLNPPVAQGQMLMASEIEADDRILLVGAGCGYLAALLAKRSAKLVAVEENNALAEMAKMQLPDLKLVEASLNDGAAADGPYSLMLIDGAVDTIPDSLLDQLEEGGRVVAGLREGPVSRLAIGYKRAGHVSLRPFADMELAALPGFAKTREFVF